MRPDIEQWIEVAGDSTVTQVALDCLQHLTQSVGQKRHAAETEAGGHLIPVRLRIAVRWPYGASNWAAQIAAAENRHSRSWHAIATLFQPSAVSSPKSRVEL